MSDAEPIIRPNANGTPSIRGSRINIFHVMDYYLANDPPEWVAAEALRVPAEDVIAAYAYIREHEAGLMPTYTRIVERNRRGNSPEVTAKLEESHRRFMAKLDPSRRARAEELLAGGDDGTRAAG